MLLKERRIHPKDKAYSLIDIRHMKTLENISSKESLTTQKLYDREKLSIHSSEIVFIYIYSCTCYLIFLS